MARRVQEALNRSRSYSSIDSRLRFNLGTASANLKIRWASGEKEVATEVRAGQVVVIKVGWDRQARDAGQASMVLSERVCGVGITDEPSGRF